MTSRSIVVLDPPWEYKAYPKKNQTRTAANHYDIMTNQELLSLAPLMKTAFGPESIMCMWITSANLPFGIELLKSYGYDYKTVMFTWIKLNEKFNDKLIRTAKTIVNIPPTESDSIAALEKLTFMSLGHWTRSNVEYVIVGSRGKEPLQRLRKDIRQVVFAPIMEHSRKPDEVNKRIENMLLRPGDKIYELFARRQFSNWICTGNELDGLDIKDFLTVETKMKISGLGI